PTTSNLCRCRARHRPAQGRYETSRQDLTSDGRPDMKTPAKQPVSAELLERVRDRIQREGIALGPETLASAVRSQNRLLGADTVLSVVERLQLDLMDAGALQPLLNRPDVTDVLVNGAESLWVDAG